MSLSKVLCIFCIFVFTYLYFVFLYWLIRILRICHNEIGDSIMLVSSHIVGAPKPIGTSGECRGISNRQTTPTKQPTYMLRIHANTRRGISNRQTTPTNQHICCKYTYVHMCCWQTYKYKDDTNVDMDWKTNLQNRVKSKISNTNISTTKV